MIYIKKTSLSRVIVEEISWIILYEKKYLNYSSENRNNQSLEQISWVLFIYFTCWKSAFYYLRYIEEVFNRQCIPALVKLCAIHAYTMSTNSQIFYLFKVSSKMMIYTCIFTNCAKLIYTHDQAYYSSRCLHLKASKYDTIQFPE